MRISESNSTRFDFGGHASNDSCIRIRELPACRALANPFQGSSMGGNGKNTRGNRNRNPVLAILVTAWLIVLCCVLSLNRVGGADNQLAQPNDFSPPLSPGIGNDSGASNSLFCATEKPRVTESNLQGLLAVHRTSGTAKIGGGAAAIPRNSARPAGNPTTSLSEPLVLSLDGGGLPDMAADRFGRVHVVWQGPDSFIWYSQVGADGKVSVPATKVYGVVKAGPPRIAVDREGDAHVVFTLPGGEFKGVMYIKLSGGNLVRANAFQMFPPNGLFEIEQDSWPSIAINPVTQLPVVAADVTTSYTVQFGFPFPIPVTVWNEYVRTVSLDAAGKPANYFSAYFLDRIPSPQFRAEYSSVAVDSLGTIHVVWVHRDPQWNGWSVGYARSGDDAWVEIANSRNVSGLSGRPRIIAGEGSNVDVVWATTDGATIWQEMNHKGETTVDDTVVSQPGAKGRWPGIASGFGELICAWADSREKSSTQIYTRSLFDVAAEVNISESPATAFNSVVAVPSKDRLAYAWQDTRSGTNQIYYREHRTVTSEMADLVASVTINGGEFLPGGGINVNIEIRNQGRQPAQGIVLLNLFLSQDGLPQDSYISLGQFSVPLDIEGGGVAEWTRAVMLSDGTSPPLDRAGSRIIVAEINQSHSVEEADYDNNKAISKCFFMGNIVNVVTHGFNLRPPTLKVGGESWQSFWLPFHELARDLQHLPKAGSLLDGHVGSHVVEWSSDVGFWNAFFDLFIGEMAEAYAVKFAAEPERQLLLREGARLLREAAVNHTVQSKREAQNAAASASSNNLGGLLMTSPDLSRRYQRIALLGHSRGASVNARLARLLTDRRYVISEFIALDGFGTDWPSPGGLIGDFDIAVEASVAQLKVNYRVEQDISEMLLAKIGADGNPFGNFFWDVFVAQLMPELLKATRNPGWERLGELLKAVAPTEDVREYLLGLDLRAPERWGLDNSPVLTGPVLSGKKEKSNHLNITKYYQDLIAVWASPSFVGRHRNDDSCVKWSEDKFEFSSTLGEGSVVATLSRHGPDGDLELSNFSDPTFEQTGDLLRRAAALPPELSGDPIVDSWLQIALSPKMLMENHWQQQGEADVAVLGTNSFAKLIQTTNTSIAQLIQLLGGRKTVEFDLRTVAVGAGDTVQVIVGDAVVGEIPLAVSDDFNHLSVRIDSFSDWKSVGFRLGGSAEVPSEVWLDNVAIVYEPPRIKLAKQLADGRFKLVIDTVTGASFALDVSRDLKNWFERSVITATRDEVEHFEDFQEGTPALFYRLRAVGSEVGTY